MMEPLKNLIQASFKNIPFFVKTEQRNGGRKLKIYEHPYTYKRTVQDLGRRLPTYVIQAVVFGDNYLFSAKKLRRVCENSTEGTLSIPSFGIFTAYCLKISENISDKSHGVVTFDLEFAITKSSNIPSFATQTTANAEGGRVLVALTEEFKSRFEVTPNPNNKDVIKKDVEQATVDINKAVPDSDTWTDTLLNKLNTVISDVDDFTNALMREGLLGLIMNDLPVDGSALGNVKQLWTFGNNLTLTLPYLLEDIDILTSLGKKNILFGPYYIPLWLKNTKDRKNRTNNRITLVGTIRSFGVLAYLDQAAKTSYRTDRDIDNAISEIDTVFKNVIYDSTLNLSSSVRKSFEDMKTVVYKELEEKRQKAYKLAQIPLKGETTTALLAYQLYYEEIVNSNSISLFYTLSDILGNLNKYKRRDSLYGDTTVLEVENAQS